MSTEIAKPQTKLEAFRAKLFGCIDQIRAVLPEHKKTDAERHVQRCWLYFLRTPYIHDCSIGSFVQCCLDSAELGLSLDGKMAHAVAFNTKVKHADGTFTWEKKCQFMPDFKGLVAVAKRTNVVADIYGDIVGENDEFECGREGERSILKHKPNLKSRGAAIGAYVVVSLRGVPWRYEYMTREQIDHIRSKSKAKDDGPWVTDYDQMAIKTVVKRALKFYMDDPTLIRAIQLDDAIDVEFETNAATSAKPKRVSYQPISLPAEVARDAPAFATSTQEHEPEVEVEAAKEAKPKRASVVTTDTKKPTGDQYGFSKCNTIEEVASREDYWLNGPEAVPQIEHASVRHAAASRREILSAGT